MPIKWSKLNFNFHEMPFSSGRCRPVEKGRGRRQPVEKGSIYMLFYYQGIYIITCIIDQSLVKRPIKTKILKIHIFSDAVACHFVQLLQIENYSAQILVLEQQNILI